MNYLPAISALVLFCLFLLGAFGGQGRQHPSSDQAEGAFFDTDTYTISERNLQ